MATQKAKLFLSTLALLLISSSAHALVPFLEPYVGFGNTQADVYTQTYGYAAKDIATGYMLGIKGGVNLTEQFFIGADYSTSGPYSFGTLLNQATWNQRMLGAGAGMDYKVIRFWVGYYASDTITSSDKSNNQSTYSGNAVKIGFGLVVLKNVHANVDLTFHNVSLGSSPTTFQSGTTTPAVTNVQSANVSISMPIDLK